MPREIVTSENREEYINKKLGKKEQKQKKHFRLPSSESLSIPNVPSVDLLKKYGRKEDVPLDKARATQSKMDWDKFEKGEHPKELIKGYGDRPVAVRKENGEYLIYDGHHRTVLAMNAGKKHLNMHVIDAKTYAPEAAGKKPVKEKVSTDELMKELLS